MARDLGYRVEEHDITVDELFTWAGKGEAALMGTAAVLAGVGRFLDDGNTVQVGDGHVGPNTQRLSQALIAVQQGQAPDRWEWTEPASNKCATEPL